ncbi:O-antigen polymerase [Arthrobacter bambusae]|uniref:O-antigen polymerase n=1 Tax=Arthrobacter bambusae TaxID=1338426 RepID=UPI00278A3992|nr:O-antigen polymerase [Arthrobacter bambusae]MDQ0212054.1 oligosaccharide repeat unit polymerase [Arthrobacter bambusae]MDQ0236719.1 oligosaccharide repeat unit polymerase [Arthrobacter bambusae]
MIIALMAISASLVVLSNFMQMPWLNPITALVAPWLTVMLLASIPGAMNPEPSLGLWTMVLTGFVATAVGALGGWLIAQRQVPTIPHQKRPLDIRRIIVSHWILTIALAVYGVIQAADAWPLLQRLGGVQAIFSASAALGNEYKYEYSQSRLETTSAALDGGGFASGAFGYILFLGHIALFTGAILWRSNRRILASLPLIISAAYSLFSLQRTSFFMCFLIFGATVIYAKRLETSPEQGSLTNDPRRLKRARAYILGFLVLIPVLLYPVQQRNNSTHNSTGLESLAQYLISSVAGLNARIDSNFDIATPPAEVTGALAPSPGLGAYTFTGLFTLLKRIGLPVPVAPHALDYYSVEIFGTPFSTNTGTSLVDFYLDFGWAGLIFIPLVIGLVASICLRRFISGRVSALPLLVILMVSIFWSFFVNALLGDFRYLYMAIVASPILPWIFYGRRTAQPPSPKRFSISGEMPTKS